jgi:DNA replication and repair protein RecF
MYLKRLSLVNYKNIRQAELKFEPGINCFVGNNGAGKTNLLDAVYYMSFCKSYFNAIDSQLICHNEDFFVVQAQYYRNEQSESFYAGFKKNQKKQFKRNKKEYTRLADHIGLLPLVMISPGDERLITEGSDQRRKYIDGVVSQFDKNYLALILKYNRALNQRNALLKSAKGRLSAIGEQLDIWDSQLTVIGAAVFERRTDFIAELNPVFQKYHRFISNGDERVSINYHSHHQKDDFVKQLKGSLVRDVALGYTTKGVHRDDLELILDGYSVKKTGSQGQKKTFFLAMKLAQYEFLSNHFGFAPILLLDDMFDKLDEQRASRLIELVGRETFHQIFITDTQKHRLMEVVMKTGKDFNFYKVEEGNFILDN